jgi:leucyl-tRNA synthetase
MGLGFFDLQSSRDWYREHCKAAGVGIHAGLARRFIELQALLITPIAPHWAESVWRELLQNDSTIHHAQYPIVPKPDPVLTVACEYIKSTASAITQAEAHQVKKIQKGKQAAFDPSKGKKLAIFVTDAFPAWQQQYRDTLRQQFESTGELDIKVVAGKIDKANLKRAMPFMLFLKRRLDSGEKPERVFEQRLPFDEGQVLKEMVPWLKTTVGKLEVLEIVRVKEGEKMGEVVFASETKDEIKGGIRVLLPSAAAGSTPGNPAFLFTNL